MKIIPNNKILEQQGYTFNKEFSDYIKWRIDEFEYEIENGQRGISSERIGEGLSGRLYMECLKEPDYKEYEIIEVYEV